LKKAAFLIIKQEHRVLKVSALNSGSYSQRLLAENVRDIAS